MRIFQLGVIGLIGIVLLTGAEGALARTEPVYNVVDKPIAAFSGRSLSLAEVEGVLKDAVTTKGWSVARVDDGLFQAQINVRRHFAAIDVSYDTDSYSITYRDSDVLMYDGTSIHRNYNKWIKLIEQLVDKNLASM